MKVLNFAKSEAKIKVEQLDDLWYLSSVIDSGDTVKGRTFRKIKLGESGDRNQKVIKKPVFLSIVVERVEFHSHSDILRVSGKILEGTEDIPKGSYHTINVEENTIITIVKPEWLNYQRQALNEASKEKSPDILICVLDREVAHFALMKRYGYEHLTSIEGNVQKKNAPEIKSTNFYKEIEEILQGYVTRYNIKKVITASPAFWKDELVKNIKNADLKKKIIPATCSSSDKTAINEVLKRQEVQQVLKEDRISEEAKLVDKLLTEISKEGLAVYGLKEVKSAVDSGAVTSLLITGKKIRDSREAGTFSKIERVMKSADKLKAKIHIISSEHDGGRKLDGITGIGAILRYKLNY